VLGALLTRIASESATQENNLLSPHCIGKLTTCPRRGANTVVRDYGSSYPWYGKGSRWTLEQKIGGYLASQAKIANL